LFVGAAVLAAVSISLVFYPTLQALVNVWDTQEEYSYGYLIPFLFLFLLYQRLTVLAEEPRRSSWTGAGVVVVGLVFGTLGRFSTMDTVAQYGFLLCVWGLFLSYFGWRAARVIVMPLLILAFMMPIPNYLLRETSAVLQLVSSRLGVEFIRLVGVSVYLEGNVIDLGTMKLQVVEACAGLRYLFSLLVLSFLVAYFYQDRMWKRVLIVASAVPITVLMNSFRIAVVGVTVDVWGKEAAEGVLHEFEGLTIFLGCVLILLAEIWVLTKLSGRHRKVRDVLAVDIPSHDWGKVRTLMGAPGRTTWVAIGILAAAAVAGLATPARTHAAPERPAFTGFPMELPGYKGYPGRIEPEILQVLMLDDYLMANYFDQEAHAVNLYASYYAGQAQGNSAHSPRACIPGDGWEIQAFDPHALESVRIGDQPLTVNRVLIQKGENRGLVYYWFQQRGRFVTGEYTVKLYIFLDSLLRGRTDGAMVRLVAPLAPGESPEAADARLEAFAALAMPELRRYIPE
jgi:exosortase D (VPLPA-CTERM-specific)